MWNLVKIRKFYIGFIGIRFLLVEILVHTMHSPVIKIIIYQKLRRVSKNRKWNLFLRIKFYQCVEFCRNRKNNEIDLLGNRFVLVKISVRTIHLELVKLRISRKLGEISKNGQRHINLQIKLYQCLKFGWNRMQTEFGLVGKFTILVEILCIPCTYRS